MIESKIYVQIGDFVEKNYRTKVHAYTLALYPRELMGSWASHDFFITKLPLRFILFLLCF